MFYFNCLRYVAIAQDVLIDVYMTYGDDSILMSRTVDISEDWNEVNVYLGKRQTGFHLAVKSRPSGTEDLIAIDDFAMVDCQLPSPNPDDCNDDKFRCGNSEGSVLLLFIKSPCYRCLYQPFCCLRWNG